MAITLTQAELSAAIRLGDSAEEIAEATRLLAYVTEAITRHLADAYDTAPEAIVNEAAIRLAGYLFDQPNAGRGLSFANAGRNSGAWAILLPFRVHRAGSTGEAVAAAQEAVGTPGNPVTNVAISGGNLVVTFDDGTTHDETLAGDAGHDGRRMRAKTAAQRMRLQPDKRKQPQRRLERGSYPELAMTGDGDRSQTRQGRSGRRSAIDGSDGATTAAAAAQSDIDAHEASTHNTDAGARTAAAAAAATAATAQTTASTARDAATAAQADAQT